MSSRSKAQQAYNRYKQAQKNQKKKKVVTTQTKQQEKTNRAVTNRKASGNYSSFRGSTYYSTRAGGNPGRTSEGSVQNTTSKRYNQQEQPLRRNQQELQRQNREHSSTNTGGYRMDQTGQERMKNLTVGALQQSVGSARKAFSGFMSGVTDNQARSGSYGGVQTHRNGTQDFMTRRNDRLTDEQLKAKETGIQKSRTTSKILSEAQDLYTKKESKSASKQIAKGTEKIEKGKEGLGAVGRFGADLYTGAVQLGADIGIGALTGSALLPMGVRAFGGAVDEAEQAGASWKQQMAYGGLTAGIELGSEKLFNVGPALNSAFGKGVGDELVNKITKKAGESALKGSLRTIGAATVTEALEEMVAEGLEPMVANAIYADAIGGDAVQDSLLNNPVQAGLNMLRAGAIGGALGGPLGAAGVVMQNRQGKKISEQATNIYGPDGIKALAQQGTGVADEKDAAFAQAVLESVKKGEGVANIQVARLQEIINKQRKADTDRMQSSVNAADQAIRDNNYSMPTNKGQERYAKAGEEAKSMVSYLTGKRLSEDSQNMVAHSVASIAAGSADIDEITMALSSDEARTTTENVLGVDLRGKSYAEAKAALIDLTQFNREEAAREQTIYDDNLAKGEFKAAKTVFAAKGQSAFDEVFADKDARGLGTDGLADRQAVTFEAYYRAGQAGIPIDRMRQAGIYTALSTEDQKRAWDAGREDFYNEQLSAFSEATALKRAVRTGSQNRGGTVNIDSLNEENRAIVMENMDKWQKIAQATGIDIVFDDNLVVRSKDGQNSMKEEEINGHFDPKNRRITLSMNNFIVGEENVVEYVFAHEFTHFMKLFAPGEYLQLKDFCRRWLLERGQYEAKIDYYRHNMGYGDQMSEDEILDEILCDTACGFSRGEGQEFDFDAFVSAVCGEDINVAKKIIQAIKDIINKIRIALSGNQDPVLYKALDTYKEAQEKWYEGVRVATERRNAVGEAQTRGMNSFKGYAKDGRGIYESNYPAKTSATYKSKNIRDLINNVWSKRPIELVVREEGKPERTIQAEYDPYYDGTTTTDASKISAGNTMGTSAEKRVNLNLGPDYYQILSEAEYLDSTNEDQEHEESRVHQSGQVWHYFINGIYYKEVGKEKTEPYHVIVNVRENEDGSFVYGYETYKDENLPKALKRKRISMRPTLVDSGKAVNIDDSSIDIVEDSDTEVKKSMKELVTLSDQRIDNLIDEYAIPGNTTSNYSKAWITSINPRDFLKLTISDEELEKWTPGSTNMWGQEVRELEPEDLKAKGKYDTLMPFLKVNSFNSHSVISHEGRHRMLALLRAGYEDVPVVIYDTSESAKSNRQYEEEFDLWSQDHGDGPVNSDDDIGYRVDVYDLIPINEKNRAEIERMYGGDTEVQFSRKVTDQDTIDFLENQDHVEVYRAMALIDGKLYPPMATKVEGQLQNPSEIGSWEEAEERPDLVDDKGKFKLTKDNGGNVPARYNPYIHTSLSPFNDQFTSAYKRPNLVVVRGLVPESELSSGYKADKAKDPVGKTKWHSGVRSTKLPESREVILTRWFKPTEIVDDSEVAAEIKRLLDTLPEDSEYKNVPYNVVSPGVRRELENIGVPIVEGEGQRNLPPMKSVSYSRKYTPEEQQEHRDMLLGECREFYGAATTEDYKESGYILPDGRMPKMGDMGIRGEDHIMAGTAYDDLWGSSAQNQFISEGNIRFTPEILGFEMSQEPTEEQYDRIRKIIDDVYADPTLNMVADGIRIDFTDEDGRVLDIQVFNGTSAEGIIGSIKAHFAGGTVTPMRQFLSRKDSEGRYLSEGQMEYFKDSKARDAYGHLIPVYHSSDAEFTEFDEDRRGKSTGSLNTAYGFFTSPYERFSKQFGKNTKKMYANITRPIIHPLNCEYKYPGREDEIVRTWFETVDPYQIPFMEEAIAEGETAYDYYMNAFPAEAYEAAKDEREAVEAAGYDGIEIIEGFGAEFSFADIGFDPVSSFVVFNSNQLKDVDNLDPTDNADIRLSRKGEPRGNKTQQKRDRGEKLTESQFYRIYSVHKLNLRGMDNLQEQIENIKEEGFKGDGGFGNNVVPASINNVSRYTEEEMRDLGVGEEEIERRKQSDEWKDGAWFPQMNIVESRYGGRKGDTVMFVSEADLDKTPSTEKVKSGYKPFDYEIVTVERDFQPYYELYDKAYDKAKEEQRKEFEDAGLFMSEGGSVSMLSRKSWEETDKKKLKDRLLKAGFEEDEIESWMKEIDTVAAIIGEDAARLDYIAARQHSFKKPDGDYYKYTLDSSTLCAKRLLYQGTYDAIMHVLRDVPLMENDVIRIRQMMAERMHEVPCGICYVESQRKTLGRYASEWLKDYKGDYIPSLDEVVSTDGLEWLRTEHPQTYEDFTKAMSAKGVSSPKVVQLRTDYREDLVRMTAATVEYLNMIGGLRWNSFSDFETPHLIDFMQALLDMSAKGLMGMAYTKVPNLVKVFGPCGVKFNLSLIPKVDENGNVEHDEDGRIVFDDVEGMSIEDAIELRDKYPDNVATILVAKDKAHMLEAMNDDRVDFIIPFHRSKWTMAEFEELGLRGYEDFATGDQENPIFPSEYWDYSISQKKGGGRKNAETYLKLCAERGEKPAFSKLLVDNGDESYSLPKGNSKEATTIRNGYYKLIIEGKMFNHKTGKGAPQQKVKMNVDMDAARKVLAEYDGDPNALPVAEDVVRDFVKEKTGREVDGSLKFSRKTDSEGRTLSEGQEQFFADSQARDEDGNLMVMYHGTPDADFKVFAKVWHKDHDGFFFTSSREAAETYMRGENATETAGVKEVYLNLTNPLIIDAKGQGGYDIRAFTSLEAQRRADEIEARLDEIRDAWNKGTDNGEYERLQEEYEYLDENEWIAGDTDSWVDYAMEAGHDGLIIYNVYDAAPYGEYEEVGSFTEMIAFSSEQIKDVTNLNPTTSENIYFSKKAPEPIDEDEVSDIMASDPTIVDTMYGWGMSTPEGQNLHEQTKEELIHKIEKLQQDMTITDGKILDEKSVREEMNKLVVNMGIEEDRWTGQMLGEVRMNKTNRGLVEDLVGTAKTIWKELQNGNYEAAVISAMNVAEHVVDNLLLTEDTMYKEYKELVDYLRDTKWELNPIYHGDFADGFTEFKKDYRGKIRIVKSGGRSPDEMWGEMCELWPEFFSEEITNPADMMKRMAEVRDSLDPYSAMLSEENQQLILRDAAADIIEIVSNGKPLETWADKRENYYREKIARLKARQQEAIRDIKEKQNWKDAEKKLATQMAEGKKKAQQQRAKQESKEKKADDKGKRQTIAKISKNLDWLSGRLLKPSDDKHLPEGYRNVVAQMLAAIDPQTERSKALEEKYGVSKKRFKWLQLRSEYEKIAAGESYGFILDDQIMDDMQELSDVLGDGDFQLANMTYDELQKVYRIVRSIRHGIMMQNRMFSDELKGRAEDYGRNAIETAEMYINDFGTDRKGIPGKIHGSGLPIFDEGMLTPRDYFEYIGGGLNDAFLALRRGQDEQIKKINYMRSFFDSIFRDYGKETRFRHRAKPGSELEAWRDGKNKKEFQCEGGTIELTPSQVMSLYCLMKREQAQGHILGSGIKASVVNKKNLLLGENLKEFFAGKGDKKTRGRRVSVTAEDVMNIVSSLTEEQRDIADKMQTLMSTVMSDWGNEASMKMFGYRKFTEENYFPIECESTYLATDFDVRQTAERVKNPNFAKSTQKGANNPVVIDDIFSVCADHCNRMAMYSAYAPAIADFQRVFNFVDRDPETGLQNGSVKESLQSAYGDRAIKYIERFMTDLNGTTPTTHDDLNRLVAKSLANYKKAAIGGNLRVAVQQPTAMIRALLYISPKYFMGRMQLRKEIKDMTEHCPIALWKSWGFSQVDMARDLEDIMMNQEWSRFDMLTMEIYSFLDLVTWGQIWRAVKNEVQAENKGVEVGSEEFYRLCNERASYIFDKSQVVDSVFHKSQVMRNTDVMSKMMTSFMAEPMRTFNMVGSEFQKAAKMWHKGDKAGAMKVYGKAFNVFILNAAVVSMAAAVVDMLRGKGGDDDDDDDKFGLMLNNFIENMKSNALPHTFIPGVSDVVELFTDDWGAKNMSLEGYEKLAKAVKDMFDDDKTWPEKIKGLVENGGYVFGIPTKNIMRELKTAFDILGVDVLAAEESDEVEEVKFTDKFFGMFKDDEKKSDKKSGKKEKDDEEEEEEEELEDYIDTTEKHRLLDKVFNKMDIEEDSGLDNFLDKHGFTLTREEAIGRAFDQKAEKVKAKGEDKEGEEKEKAIWKAATEGYTKYLDQGDMDTIHEMRTVYTMAGGDGEYFDQKIREKMRSAYKKTIGTPGKMGAQEEMRNYLLEKGGMTEEEISSEIVYKSDTAKKFAIAAQDGKDAQAIACLVSLYMAGMTSEDAQKLWDNRWRYGNGKNKPGHATGHFSWPCSGPITSRFGRRNAPTAGASSNHPSIDIGVSSGTQICAADGGVVIYTGYNGGYGNSVGIDHGNGFVTYYNHLSSWQVEKGTRIKKGQPIALSGSTGVSTGPHLDFKILKDGSPVDPMQYLN